MASPPDYDKEPKAPDKSANNVHAEDIKTQNDSSGTHPPEPDSKSHNNVPNTDAEKHVETLDDGQLRALLDEAITYKCPKDREGKSSLFKELLEEVEQDEQACEAAARELTGSRGRRAGKGRRALPHSNSLQDLVAALAAEPAVPRRRVARDAHAPPAQVSARAIHGGSLPSGVDTSFLLSEEPTRGGYLATVRCVNPPPLSERRVSVDSSRSDNEPRRSKPSSSVGVTYTARATLEIGAAGRALTTTSPSNQDKLKALAGKHKRKGGNEQHCQRTKPRGRELGATTNEEKQRADKPLLEIPSKPKANINKNKRTKKQQQDKPSKKPVENEAKSVKSKKATFEPNADTGRSQALYSSINNWYEGLSEYLVPKVTQQQNNGAIPKNFESKTQYSVLKHSDIEQNEVQTKKLNRPSQNRSLDDHLLLSSKINESDVISLDASSCDTDDWYRGLEEYSEVMKKISSKELDNVKKHYFGDLSQDISNEIYRVEPLAMQDETSLSKSSEFTKGRSVYDSFKNAKTNDFENCKMGGIVIKPHNDCDDFESDISLRNAYRRRVGKLLAPKSVDINPRNVKSMTIGTPSVPQSANSTKYITNIHKYQPISTKDVDSQITSSKPAPESNNKSIIEKKKKKKIKEVKDKDSEPTNVIEMKDFNEKHIEEIELVDIAKVGHKSDESFSKYCTDQQNLFNALEANDYDTTIQEGAKAEVKVEKLMQGNYNHKNIVNINETVIDMGDFDDIELIHINPSTVEEVFETQTDHDIAVSNDSSENHTSLELGNVAGNVIEKTETVVEEVSSPEEQKKTSGGHYILAELPNNAYIFLTLPKRLSNTNQDTATRAIENNNIQPYATGEKQKHKRKKPKPTSADSDKNTVINNDVLKELLIENLFKNYPATSRGLSTDKQVDSAIPFSCITTPEVVSSCNTTSATTPSSTAIVDPKPRSSVVTSTVNGLPLARPGAAASPPDDYKVSILTEHYRLQKSLDENGNAVQNYGSILSGASQHKKPRRKKTSKNETVIKSHQIDGYQGNKDLNEVLRFIESHAARPKLRKHRDDDEKKARASRRKESPGGAPRAASLEDVSRTSLAELAAHDAPAGSDADHDADFTTVTKRRARRRRPPPPPAAGDRSNDSTDDGYAVPDLISSCREYPALQAPRRAAAPRRAPDLVCDRRAPPPVLLRPRRASPRSARHLQGVTFGFELNETLLAPPPPAPAAHPPPPRYRPPPAALDPRLLHPIVTYVAHAWEDVIKCGNGKVRYFNE